MWIKKKYLFLVRNALFEYLRKKDVFSSETQYKEYADFYHSVCKAIRKEIKEIKENGSIKK